MVRGFDFPVESARSYARRNQRVKRAICSEMLRITGLSISLIVLLLGEGCSAKPRKGLENSPRKATLFLTTDLQGTTEPCGCTTDPLGDLARTAKIVADARNSGRAVVHLDGGSTLFSETSLSNERKPQESLKAKLVRDVFTNQLKTSAIGLGPFDLSLGPDAIQLPRHASNLKEGQGITLAAPQIIDANGVRIGVFGAVSEDKSLWGSLQVTSAREAATKSLQLLEAEKPDVIVALLHMTKKEAVALVKQTQGISFAIVGRTIQETELRIRHEPTLVDKTWLIEPADRGQVLAQLDISLPTTAKGDFADAIGESRAQIAIEDLEEDAVDQRRELEEWKKDKNADKAFLAQKVRELESLEAEIASLKKSPLRIPKDKNWFVFSQKRIAKSLSCDTDVVAMKKAYDKDAGAANQKAATIKPAQPEQGTAAYLGVEECELCHAEATEFWQKTKHFQAWETLEAANKQFNLECTGCHVTGWQKPGGSNLAHYEPFKDVQCEVCHGPGSLHVDADGKDSPRTVVLSPPKDLCVECHSAEHSDTFQFEAYLRDVTGVGHGAKFREQLGDGPTGGELRAAGLKAAGSKMGAGCEK